jgi:hypothetical protein
MERFNGASIAAKKDLLPASSVNTRATKFTAGTARHKAVSMCQSGRRITGQAHGRRLLSWPNATHAKCRCFM